VVFFSRYSLIFRSKFIALVRELSVLLNVGKAALKDDLVVAVSSRWPPLEP
jgi:hypothetical protein